MMDVESLSSEIYQQSIFLELLSKDLETLTYNLKFCDDIETLERQLRRVKKISVEMFSIINGMETIKRMSEI